MFEPFVSAIFGVETSIFVFAIVVTLVAVAFDYVNGLHGECETGS